MAVVGWDGSNIVNLNTSTSELLNIQFRAIGAPGVVAIDIDTTAEAPTPLELWTSNATQVPTTPTVVDGTVTIQ